MMVGSAEKSKGGVTTVISILKQCPFWNQYQCYWLGTQIQGTYQQKLIQCTKAYIIAFFTIWKYNIIHFHAVPDISLIVQLPVFLLAKFARKKIILHLHVGNQIEEYKESRLFQYCMKKSDLVLVLAKIWKNKLQVLFPHITTPVQYLYNPYTPVRSINYSYHTQTIIYAAHLNKNKAYDVLLKGFKEISGKYRDWKLIIMGDGETDSAKELASKLELTPEQVEFTGYIVGKQKEEYFQHASIFCMCSYREGFPMVVLEAWAYGIPVITTPVGGLPDVIEENKNACIFNFGDYKGLADQLDYLMSNGQLRQSMSRYSKKFVENNFSTKRISNELSSIYDHLYT